MCQSIQQLSYFATKSTYFKKMLEAIQMSDVSAGKKAIKPIFELAEKG